MENKIKPNAEYGVDNQRIFLAMFLLKHWLKECNWMYIFSKNGEKSKKSIDFRIENSSYEVKSVVSKRKDNTINIDNQPSERIISAAKQLEENSQDKDNRIIVTNMYFETNKIIKFDNSTNKDFYKLSKLSKSFEYDKKNNIDKNIWNTIDIFCLGVDDPLTTEELEKKSFEYIKDILIAKTKNSIKEDKLKRVYLSTIVIFKGIISKIRTKDNKVNAMRYLFFFNMINYDYVYDITKEYESIKFIDNIEEIIKLIERKIFTSNDKESIINDESIEKIFNELGWKKEKTSSLIEQMWENKKNALIVMEGY